MRLRRKIFWPPPLAAGRPVGFLGMIIAAQLADDQPRSRAVHLGALFTGSSCADLRSNRRGDVGRIIEMAGAIDYASGPLETKRPSRRGGRTSTGLRCERRSALSLMQSVNEETHSAPWSKRRRRILGLLRLSQMPRDSRGLRSQDRIAGRRTRRARARALPGGIGAIRWRVEGIVGDGGNG